MTHAKISTYRATQKEAIERAMEEIEFNGYKIINEDHCERNGVVYPYKIHTEETNNIYPHRKWAWSYKISKY